MEEALVARLGECNNQSVANAIWGLAILKASVCYLHLWTPPAPPVSPARPVVGACLTRCRPRLLQTTARRPGMQRSAFEVLLERYLQLEDEGQIVDVMRHQVRAAEQGGGGAASCATQGREGHARYGAAQGMRGGIGRQTAAGSGRTGRGCSARQEAGLPGPVSLQPLHRRCCLR